MNTKKVKPTKEFSFKGTTISTLEPNNLNRESSPHPVEPSEQEFEKPTRHSQLSNSADVSSLDQSAGRSFCSDDNFRDQRDLSQFKSDKSDNESIKKLKIPPKTQLNSLKKSTEIQDNLIFQHTLIYKTDSEIVDPISTAKTPFLVEKQYDIPLISQIFDISGDFFGVWVYTAPIAFYFGGIYLSLVTFWFCSVMIYYSEMLFVSCAVLSKRTTYLEIIQVTLGYFFSSIVKVWLGLYRLCQILIALIVINKTMSYLLAIIINKPNDSNILVEINNKIWSPCFFVLIIMPMGFLRKKIWFVSQANKIGFLVGVYILILIIYEAFTKTSLSNRYRATKDIDTTGILNMFPMACYGFCQGDRVLRYFQKMKNSNIKKIGNSLRPSRIINYFIVAAFGVFGYMTWSINPDIDLQYQIVILAPYPANPAWILAYISIIAATLLNISDNVKNLENELMVKNRLLNKIVTMLLLTLCVIISIFIYSVKEIMIWAGCLISAPVIFLI